MNTRLLRKVARRILAEPKGFIMGTVFQRLGVGYSRVYESEQINGRDQWKFPACGTAACISGHACLIEGKKNPTWEIGKRLLGLRKPEDERLFAVYAWPEAFRNAFLSRKTPQARARVAVARIEHFIKTKGAE